MKHNPNPARGFSPHQPPPIPGMARAHSTLAKIPDKSTLTNVIWYCILHARFTALRQKHIQGGRVPMPSESIHKKLGRVRPPRVHVTYDVEVGDAIEKKELPFVMGVLGDFTGQPEQPLPKLKDRRFVEVTPDNFDSVVESMKPHLAFAVENKLSDDSNAGQLKVDLHFKSLEDFEPEQVARQVKPLRELLDLRTRLNDMKGTLQTNEKLDEALLDAVGKTEKLNKLKTELGGKEESNG